MTDIGHGASLAFGSFSGNIISIDGPGLSVDDVETTHLLSAGGTKEFIPGLEDSGEVTAEIHFDPDEDDPRDEGVATLTITFPVPAGLTSGATWAASAYVNQYAPSTPVDDLMKASIKWRLTGVVTMTNAS